MTTFLYLFYFQLSLNLTQHLVKLRIISASNFVQIGWYLLPQKYPQICQKRFKIVPMIFDKLQHPFKLEQGGWTFLRSSKKYQRGSVECFIGIGANLLCQELIKKSKLPNFFQIFSVSLFFLAT